VERVGSRRFSFLTAPRIRTHVKCEEITDSSGAEQLGERDRMPADAVNPWFLRVFPPTRRTCVSLDPTTGQVADPDEREAVTPLV
jgi:hypothetical protein